MVQLLSELPPIEEETLPHGANCPLSPFAATAPASPFLLPLSPQAIYLPYVSLRPSTLLEDPTPLVNCHGKRRLVSC